MRDHIPRGSLHPCHQPRINVVCGRWFLGRFLNNEPFRWKTANLF